MIDAEQVASAAQKLAHQNSEALEILLARRELAIRDDARLGDQLDLNPTYVEQTMNVEELRALGHAIVNRWNKELYGVVCGGGKVSDKERQALLGALNLGEAATIGMLATALLALSVPGAIAAALAPILVRRFVWPAKEELCSAWKEAIESAD